MAKFDIKEISKIMRHIDVCMMATLNADGVIETRPMSNNREVEFDGHSYFFAHKSSSVFQQLAANPHTILSYAGTHSMLNRKDVYISLTGTAKLIDDKSIMRQHWVKDLEVYFEDGIDTPGVILIHVTSEKVKYWDGEEDGELQLG